MCSRGCPPNAQLDCLHHTTHIHANDIETCARTLNDQSEIYAHTCANKGHTLTAYSEKCIFRGVIFIFAARSQQLSRRQSSKDFDTSHGQIV